MQAWPRHCLPCLSDVLYINDIALNKSILRKCKILVLILFLQSVFHFFPLQVTWRPGKVTVYPQQVSVSVTEPFSSNITNLPRKLVGALLLELGHKVTVLEVYPIQNQGKEVDEIAEALEQLRCGHTVNNIWGLSLSIGQYFTIDITLQCQIVSQHEYKEGTYNLYRNVIYFII